MKRFGRRFIIALLTFTVGVTIAALSHLRPTSPVALEKRASQQGPESSAGEVSAWQVLLSFEGRDLREVDRESGLRLDGAVEAILGKRSERQLAPLVPRLVSKLSNACGQTRYAFIEEQPLLRIPGESRINAHVFDAEGNLITSSDFISGYRISLTEMEVRHLPEIGREVLVVNSQRSINGADIARQYYALVGEKILLIRLEDSGGRLVRNTYGAPNYTIGVTLTGRSADEWVKGLESYDTAEVLATLTWLGGTHLNPRTRMSGEFLEEMRETLLVEGLRSREDVKETLNALRHSENDWVRDAAEITRTVKYNF